MKKKNNKSTLSIKKDEKLNEFVNKVKAGDYTNKQANNSLRINTCYKSNTANISYIFGVK